ncbi:hypothetical protein [Natrialba sp. SSL1]|uniref:hypothetical protein n=1 Tax=Natrialba sp. SSL1 TaxID=1869245 RepID=UPI0008F93E55|nr:hypothetical protein [Natrialba sp. SSL1]OIB58417.1 hypothetical protein BBD46_08835 [Natrialba sp. SSL1]
MHNSRRGFHYTAPPNPDGERTPMTDTDTDTNTEATIETDTEESPQDAITPSKPADRLPADD